MSISEKRENARENATSKSDISVSKSQSQSQSQSQSDDDDEPNRKIPRWLTRAMAEDFSHRYVLITTLREAFVYIIFVIAVAFATVGRRNNYTYHLTKGIMSQFIFKKFKTHNTQEITFENIRSVNDFWEYLTTIFLYSLYTVKYYDRFVSVQIAPKEDQNILFENTVLGVPRLRQVKMRHDSCFIHEFFRRLFTTCYDMYSIANEDKSSFGAGTGTAWVYSDEEKTKSLAYSASIATYSGGGYYQDLGQTEAESHAILNTLKSGFWISRGTRAVFLDWTVYNVNINLFCIIKLVFEFPPTGGIIPSYSFQSVQLLYYLTSDDYVTSVFEYIVYLLGVFYICEEIREIFYFGFRYFLQFWTYIDILLILFTIANVLTSLIIFPNVDDNIEEILKNEKLYGNMEYLGNMKTLYNYFAAALFFLSFIKIFKYLNFNQTMGQLNNTLKKCAFDILGFSIMFFIIFFAFAELGYLLFGSQVEDFSTFGVAMFTLLRTILGDFEYQAIERANRFLAPIYFLSYIFFVFFVLLNMFLAIINDSYSDVKTEIAITPEEMQMSEFLLSGLYDLFGKCGLHFRFDFMQKKTLLATINQITEALIRCGFSDEEIKLFYQRSQIDKLTDDGNFDVKALVKNLEEQASTIENDDESLVHINDFIADKDRLIQIEQGIKNLSGKINLFIAKVDEVIARTKK